MISTEWLMKLNKEFRQAGIEHRRRPWEAVRRYSLENNIPVNLSSDLAKEIFEWFEANSKPRAHQMGAQYEAVYFFDSAFWVVSVPICFGKVRLNALEGLSEMPELLRNELMSDQRQAWGYVVYWADCVDYGLGIDDLRKSNGLNEFGMKLLMAGDQELRSAVSMLKENRPDPRSILSCRMATEIFLKAFVALKGELTEAEAKNQLGHNLNKVFDKFIDVSGYRHWQPVREKLTVFPDIHERYSEQEISLEKLWSGFAIAQSLGALIVREYTERNTIGQVMSPLQPPGQPA